MADEHKFHCAETGPRVMEMAIVVVLGADAVGEHVLAELARLLGEFSEKQIRALKADMSRN